MVFTCVPSASQGLVDFFFYFIPLRLKSYTRIGEHVQAISDSAQPPACISESDKAHLGFAGDERSGPHSPGPLGFVKTL